MDKGILVPLDGSRFSEAALPIAMRLAIRERLPITLASVWDFMIPLYDGSAHMDSWEAERRIEMERYLASVALRVEAVCGAPIRTVDRIGRPGEVLPSLPAELDLGMVVMSTHGHGALSRLWLGNVADKVARKSGVPVLFVRPEEDGEEVAIEPAAPLRKILVPLDGSENAELALDRNVLIGAEAAPVEVTLLRLLAFPLPPRPSGDEVVLPEGVVRAQTVAAQAYMNEVGERMSRWGCTIVTRVVEEASPWTGIVDYAARNNMDLIAMTSHGRSGVSRWVMGSVAERVLRLTDRPVLLFPPKRAERPWADIEQLAGQVAGMP